MAARIERLVTSGQFSLDGGTWDVDNNVWIVGDDTEVIVIDAAHDASAIADGLSRSSSFASGRNFLSGGISMPPSTLT